MRVKPYLQLVRLPNLFTAMADGLAGWLLAGGRLDDLAHWPFLVVASLAIYAGGVVLNDVFDYHVDLRERPKRPLPSGLVSRRGAAVVGSLLMAAGVASAWAASTRYGVVVAGALVAAVLAYDARLKSTMLGPQVMGTCRGLNLLLGLSNLANLGGPAAWTVAAAYATFVAGITWISRSEVAPAEGYSPGVAVGVLFQNAALVLLLAVSVHPEWLPGEPTEWMWHTSGGVLLLMGVGIAVNRQTIAAIASSRPEVVQGAVKAGIMALVWLHVGVLLAVRGPIEAASVAWLWLPAVVSGRWVYST